MLLSATTYKHLDLERQLSRLGFFMAQAAETYKVADLICLFVFLVLAYYVSKGSEWLFMMNIQRPTQLLLCDAAHLAGVSIALSCRSPLALPVWAVIILAPTSPLRTVFPGLVFRAPFAATFKSAIDMVTPFHSGRRNNDRFSAITAWDGELLLSARVFHSRSFVVKFFASLESVGVLLATKMVFIAGQFIRAYVQRFTALRASRIKSFPMWVCFGRLLRLPLRFATMITKMVFSNEQLKRLSLNGRSTITAGRFHSRSKTISPPAIGAIVQVASIRLTGITGIINAKAPDGYCYLNNGDYITSCQ